MPTVIKCIVPDKRVVEVLRVLKAYAIEPPVADPIDEGPHNSAKKTFSQGSISKMVFDYIARAAKLGKKTIISRELKDDLVARGVNENSYSYGLKLALDQKKLRRTKQPSTYEIVK